MIDAFYTQPFPILDVDQDFLLREQEIQDAEDFLAYYSDPKVGRYILATKPQSLAEASAEINYCRNLFQQKKGIYWSLAHKKDNRMIGAIGIYMNTHHARGEICYDLAHAFWNQGIMSRAMAVVIDYCFNAMGLIRLEASTLVNNTASITLLKKLSFEYEGTLKKYRYYNNTYHDIEMYARVTPREIKPKKIVMPTLQVSY